MGYLQRYLYTGCKQVQHSCIPEATFVDPVVAYIAQNRSSINCAKPPSFDCYIAYLPRVFTSASSDLKPLLITATSSGATRLSLPILAHLPRSIPTSHAAQPSLSRACTRLQRGPRVRLLPLTYLLSIDTSPTPAQAISVHPRSNHIVIVHGASSRERPSDCRSCRSTPFRPVQRHSGFRPNRWSTRRFRPAGD